MPDQAAALRELVSRSARDPSRPGGPPPRVVALVGSQRDAGCSSLALNLSIAAASSGQRVVLLDADLEHGCLAARCGLPPRGSVGDVLAAHKFIEEVLLSGPGGIQLLPSRRGDRVSERAASRLPAQLPALGRVAALLLLDLGLAAEPLTSAILPHVDELLLVTTPDASSVMDAYATIKRLAGSPAKAALRLIVNQATESECAADAHRRIDRSCRKFLDCPVPCAGHVPFDPALAAFDASCRPLLSEGGASPAAAAIRRLAAQCALLAPRSVAAPAAAPVP